jgi:hypothetical protein
MAEIYVRSNTPIKTKIFWKGELFAPNSVGAYVYDVSNDSSVSPSLNPSEPIIELEATPIETDIGSYQIVLPFEYSLINRKLKIFWYYQIDGEDGEHVSYVDIVTPYANLSEAIEDLQLGSDPSDPKYKSYHELQMAEKYARKLIEDFTGQDFYPYVEAEVVYGSGSDTLPLPYKINEIWQVYENDILLIDYTSSPQVNKLGYDIKVSETGFAVRLDKSNFLDNTVYTSNGMVPPSIHDYSGQLFKQGVRYKIVGRFGWPTVPDEVEQAAIQLIGHYFGKDRLWADRYLKSVSTFDWDFEYSDLAHSGTGCAYADKLLSEYVLSNMVLI